MQVTEKVHNWIHQKSQLLDRVESTHLEFCRIFILYTENDRIGYNWKSQKGKKCMTGEW